MRIPGIDHPITLEPDGRRVTVRAGGRIIADTRSALLMREAKLAPVYYIPFSDVDQSTISRSDRSTHCPFKGDASYYDVVTDDGVIRNALWEYQQPYEAVAEIAGRVAFYAHLVEISSVE